MTDFKKTPPCPCKNPKSTATILPPHPPPKKTQPTNKKKTQNQNNPSQKSQNQNSKKQQPGKWYRAYQKLNSELIHYNSNSWSLDYVKCVS